MKPEKKPEKKKKHYDLNTEIKELSLEEIVLDDVIKLSLGHQIVSDSIIVDGEIEVNDIVIVDITKKVKVDDIVAFKSDKSIVTHRLVQKSGNKYITKGDVNDTYDKAITKNDIIGKIVLIISPKVLLEFVVLVFIIIIALALLNFDGLFDKILKKVFKVKD